MNSEATIATSRVEELLAKLRAGNSSCRGELLEAAQHRLLGLTRSIKQSYQKVGRWEQTEDIFQNASMRLYQALESVEINDARHFFRLAAMQIRRELIDTARRLDGAHGLHRHHQTQAVQTSQEVDSRNASFEAFETTHDPQSLAMWGDFHKAVDSLPEKEREVTELLWYHGLSQKEAATLMQVSDKSIQRYWLKARCRLGEMLRDDASQDLD